MMLAHPDLQLLFNKIKADKRGDDIAHGELLYSSVTDGELDDAFFWLEERKISPNDYLNLTGFNNAESTLDAALKLSGGDAEKIVALLLRHGAKTGEEILQELQDTAAKPSGLQKQ